MGGDPSFERDTFRGIPPSGRGDGPNKYVDGNIIYLLEENDGDMFDEDFYGPILVGDSKKEISRRMRLSLEDRPPFPIICGPWSR